MTATDHLWLFLLLVIAVAALLGKWADGRRKRSYDDFRRRHRDRKEEVERAARRSL